jgi:diketogulonate reductase-like aldo/keto reductase
MVKISVENGITSLDTAILYGNGTSETFLGNALKELDEETRKKVVVTSKIPPWLCLDVRKACEESLKRLQVECIDLYIVHWPISK